MKTYKILSIGVLIVGMTLAIGCNKEDNKINEPVTAAKTFKFNLTFNPGDTVGVYNGISGFKKDNVIVTYMLKNMIGSGENWEVLPGYYENKANILPTFSEEDGKMRIRTKNIDGSFGSPWSSQTIITFKAVLIKSSAIENHPNLNLSNYQAVKEAFNIED